jgi:Mg2+-importing ATPase
MLILIFAVILSSVLGEYTNSYIILGIILLSGFLGFIQERNASRAIQKLQAMVQVTCTVMRSGAIRDVPASEIVAGDVILLNAGDIIPGDCRIIEANDLHVNEATLTGESFPAEKNPDELQESTPLAKRKNCLFQGTSVVNGTARALVVTTGNNTELGKITKDLEKHQPETAFERGTRKFGYLLMRITLMLSLMILVLNLYLEKPFSDSVLFSLALAVGIAPELLPAIVTITLSAGAKRLVEKKVIVKKLASVQNLGSVNVFCSDKTGTLTEGIVSVEQTTDCEGNPSDKVRLYAYLNALYETGFTNPLDEAIRSLSNVEIKEYNKLDEVPYDFIRKRLSIVVQHKERHYIITKGAVDNILDVCRYVENKNNEVLPIDKVSEGIQKNFESFSSQGFRTIGLAYKDITGDPVINKDDETDMIFLGFIILSDPIKPGIKETIQKLRETGTTLKLITGDNQLVARHMSGEIGLRTDTLLTGTELQAMSDEALIKRVQETDVFAETEPNQKERLVRALQKAGNVVGYIGDGINDASALKTADVGISVDTAVDVAKESADLVFLQKDLKVLLDGIIEGRKTFVNTLKYIFVTTSANFGNMFSLAGTSLLLPFLPLLPKQILLANFLTDLPAMGIASDNVDAEQLRQPRQWNTLLIRNFMIVFGLISSFFDFLTFGVLLFIFKAHEEIFRTGWFIESVITEILVLLIIRTQRPVLKSRPGKYMLIASGAVILILYALPLLAPNYLGFIALPVKVLGCMMGIALLYGLTTDITKRIFFNRMKWQ